MSYIWKTVIFNFILKYAEIYKVYELSWLSHFEMKVFHIIVFLKSGFVNVFIESGNI